MVVQEHALSWVSVRLCTGLGYSSGRSFREGRPGPLTPIYHRDGPPRRQHHSSHCYGPARKSSHRGHRDARILARFFRFPRGPLIHLTACKEKKKKRMRLFMLCARWLGKHRALRSILLLKEGVFFSLSVKDKNRLKVCGTQSIFTSEIRFSVDSSLVE